MRELHQIGLVDFSHRWPSTWAITTGPSAAARGRKSPQESPGANQTLLTIYYLLLTTSYFLLLTSHYLLILTLQERIELYRTLLQGTSVSVTIGASVEEVQKSPI